MQKKAHANQPMMSTPTLDFSSIAVEGGAFRGSLESAFLAPMLECPSGAGSVQRVYRPWNLTELQAILKDLWQNICNCPQEDGSAVQTYFSRIGTCLCYQVGSRLGRSQTS